jgi:CRISPR system Cascade subunit CasC
VDVDLLARNLGQGLNQDEPATPVRRAVEAFLDGFVSSLPTGKINTFGNHTLPDAVVVKLRTNRPVSFVSAVEKPVTADEFGGHMEAACARLADYVPELERAYGEDNGATWVLRIGPATAKLASLGTEAPSLSALVSAVGQTVADRLEQHG